MSVDVPRHRFELYERNGGREKSDKEYSIRLSLSEGAHSSNVLDSAVDARHSLNVQPRRYGIIGILFRMRLTHNIAQETYTAPPIQPRHRKAI